MKGQNAQPRVAIHPQIHFGKPCVAGTRILVQDVLELLREGISFAEIIRDYLPDLEVDDIRACVQYAIEAIEIADFPRHALSKAQREELERRVADADVNPSDWVAAEDVIAAATKRLSRKFDV